MGVIVLLGGLSCISLVLSLLKLGENVKINLFYLLNLYVHNCGDHCLCHLVIKENLSCLFTEYCTLKQMLSLVIFHCICSPARYITLL